jgi:hypothetical protein
MRHRSRLLESIGGQGPNEAPPQTDLYFEDLDQAREFYTKILGLEVADEESGAMRNLTVVRVLSVWSGRGPIVSLP